MSTPRANPRILFSTFKAARSRKPNRPTAESVNRLRRDGMRDRANGKGGHHARDPQRASICRAVHRDLLARNSRVEEDLVDQLFNSSEKRLARMLLLLANFGKEGPPEPMIAKISQETLAEMIGTTRSRVSHFMKQIPGIGSY
jgi:CRP-like cAMP-binding protein